VRDRLAVWELPTGGFPACADLHESKPGLRVKRERLQMAIKKKIRLSLAEWKEISSGLELSPNDLSMITSGLRLLTKSQLELATLARTQHLEDNFADSLEDWGNKSQELLTRVIEHHSACMSKILEKQKRRN